MGWFGRWRLNKDCARFVALIRSGEIDGALTTFDQSLASQGAEVSQQLRVCYHLHRWLGMHEEKDLSSLLLLTGAGTAAAGNAIATAGQLVRQLKREQELALALNQRTPKLLTAGPSSDPGSQALETLAQAILEVRALPPNSPHAERKSAAQRILSLLPVAATLDSRPKSVLGHLFVWANLALSRHKQLIEARALLDALPPPQMEQALCAALFGMGRTALQDGRVEEAESVLATAAKVPKFTQRQAFVLAWGVAALERNSAVAAKWFITQAAHPQPDDPREWNQRMLLAAAIAQFRANRYAEGREVLGRLAKQVKAEPGEAAPQELLTQVYYLAGVSFLAGTREWATPTGGGEPQQIQADRDLRVKNRSLWGELRQRLNDVIDRLGKLGSEANWKRRLLVGLLAYVDTSTTLNPDDLAAFSAAVERTDGEAARTKLKRIEGALIARAKAVEEAVTLVRNKDYPRLRDLKETVLDSLGDAIPPAVRAAVYLTVWQGDPSYDPLPELQRITPQPGTEVVLTEAIRQVQITQALTRLGDECRSLQASGSALPAQQLFTMFDPEVGQRTALAAALVQLRRGDLAGAQNSLSSIDTGSTGSLLTWVRFYLSWRQGNAAVCRALAEAEPGNPWLSRNPSWSGALGARSLLRALDANDTDGAFRFLLAFGNGRLEHPRVTQVIVNLVVWLLERKQAPTAHRLIQKLRQEGVADLRNPGRYPQLSWALQVLAVPVAACMGQYTGLLESAQQAGSVSGQPVFGGAQEDNLMRGWVQLMKVEAELAQTARTADELKLRWKAVRRSLEGQANELFTEAEVRPYAFLIAGLLAWLNTDTLVDRATIEQLRIAQSSLPLASRAGFLETVIAELSWRKRVIDEFWYELRGGEFKHARTIYQDELLPAFGARMPHSIRLGMILVESELGVTAADTLQQRLSELHRDAPTLNRELVEKVRTAIAEGEKLRRIGQQLKSAQFDALVEFAEKATWAGFAPGTMAIPVGLALLFARFKKDQFEKAEQLGAAIARHSSVSGWVRDIASLLLGRVLFNKKDYPAAAEEFGRVSSANVLGHDTDRYWATSHFSHGLQLLAVDQKDKAFDAFAKSLAKRNGRAENVKLAPLFIHFGVTSMEAKNGNRAKQSFLLMSKTLDGLKASPEVTLHRLLADLGSLLCESLMGEQGKDITGEKFRDLRKRLEKADDLSINSGGHRVIINAILDRLFLLLGICQDIRQQIRLPANKRRKPAELHTAFLTQFESLEKLKGENQPHDPVLLTLKGCTALLWRGGASDDAMQWLEQAMALGVQSPRLAQMLNRRSDEFKKAREQKGKVLDLFDIFLASGTVPTEVKHQFIRRDNLAVLYKLNRNYAPDDFVTRGASTEVQRLSERVNHLLTFVEEDSELAREPKLKRLVDDARDLIEKITQHAAELEEAEQSVLSILAQKIREQSLESNVT
jgi:hypothetical protein